MKSRRDDLFIDWDFKQKSMEAPSGAACFFVSISQLQDTRKWEIRGGCMQEYGNPTIAVE